MKIVVRGRAWNFVQHLLEMTVAMVVGMVVFGMAAGMAFDALGWGGVTDGLVVSTLLMATYMSAGMVLWMRFRGCGWPAVLEMSLAMFVPFLIMYPPYFAGWVSASAVMVVGHVLMVPAMVVAMLFRLDEYTRVHGRRQHREPTAGKVVAEK